MEQTSYPLQRKWTIWEMWNLNTDLTPSCSKNLASVGEFDNLHYFWQHWNYIPHANPAMLFENPETKVKVIIESLNQSIEAIGVFENGVEPLREDPINKAGSDFFFEIDSFEFNKIKEVWDRIVFSIIGETLIYSEDISGCRVVDRKKVYRFEIWAKFDGQLSKHSAKSLQIKESIKKIIGNIEINIASHSSY